MKETVVKMSEHTESQHHIFVENFNTHEIIHYPIIKLLGEVECPNANHTQTEHSLFIYTNKSKTIINTVVLKNKFKALIELQIGLNEITVKCCDYSVAFNLEYIPSRATYSVVPLYIKCEGHDGKFQAPPEESNEIESALRRITLCSKLLQCITAEKLYDNGLGRKTFYLDGDCTVFKSSLNFKEARCMSQTALWEYIGREIMKSSIGSKHKKYLAFLSCTHYDGEQYSSNMKTHEEFLKITGGYVALGGGGLALFGTSCLYTWPETFEEVLQRFDDGTPVDRTKFLDDSCYRGTRSACFSTTLGSVLHELYHTFNLGHTENGIMGRGFDNIYKFFTIRSDDMCKDITKTYHSHIEFKEEFEAEKLSERLQKENQRKEFKVIRKFEEDDDTHLTKSCAVILSYHKWFNEKASTKPVFTLTYDKLSKFIKSTLGIRVVEIRNVDDEMVRYSWTFEGKVRKYSFQIPEEVFCLPNRFLVTVEDNDGNILKEIVSTS